MLLHTDVSAETVQAQVEAYAPWFYRYEFSNGVVTEGLDEYVRQVHEDRAKVIFPHLDRLFTGRWQDLSCIDIACHEGWYSFQTAERGANVLGVDVRPERIEKARWITAVARIPRVRFETRDLFALDPATDGMFDLVLFIGIFYHLEDPMRALRRARSMTRDGGVCVLEGQVARSASTAATWAGAGTEREGPTCIVLPGESYHAHAPEGIVLIPSLPALHMMLTRAGFRDVHLVLPPPDLHETYQTQDRVILFAYA